MSDQLKQRPPAHSLINLAPSVEVGIREQDSILQTLGVLAHWGRHSYTGRALWDELGKTLPTLERDRKLDMLDAETIREVVSKGESNVDVAQNSNRALMVASESWQLSLAYRTERLRQARVAFTATMACVVLGVLILATGICASILGSADFKLATYTTVVGVFVEFIGAILLWLHRAAARRLDAEAAVAHELERFRLGIALIDVIADPGARDRALRSLIRDVRDHPSVTLDGATTIYVPNNHPVEA